MNSFFSIEPDGNFYNSIVDIIEPLYNEDPFDFVFISQSEGFSTRIADVFSEHANISVPVDSFTVINKYLFSLMRKRYDKYVFFDNNLLSQFVLKIINDKINSSQDNEFITYLKSFARSRSACAYFIDIYEKKREMDFVSDESLISASGLHVAIRDVLNESNNLSKLYNLVREKHLSYVSSLESSGIKYLDWVSVYDTFIKEFQDTRIGKNLVIAGFYDILPPAFFSFDKLFNLFENVTVINCKSFSDRAFSTISFLDSFLGFPVNETEPLKLLNDVSFVSYPDPLSEAENVCSEVKSLIVNNNVNPSDIEIISMDDKISGYFQTVLSSMKLPFSFNSSVKLSESSVVKMLQKPLKTLNSGVKPEDVLCLAEFGYGGKFKYLSLDKMEMYFKKFDIIYDSGASTPDERMKFWISSIDAELKKMNIDDDEEKSKNEKIKLELVELKNILSNIFNLLKLIPNDITVENYKSFISLVLKEKLVNLYPLNNQDNNELAIEYKALKKFISLFDSLAGIISHIYPDRLSFQHEEFEVVLNNILESSAIGSSVFSPSGISVVSLQESRFSVRPYKFITGFTENKFPSIYTNPLLQPYLVSKKELFEMTEKQSRFNTFLSIMMGSKIKISFHSSGISGEPVVASPYLKDLMTLKNISEFIAIKERVIIPSDPEKIFSDADALLFYSVNQSSISNPHIESYLNDLNELKKHSVSPSWTLEPGKVKEINASKLSLYIDCPFKFFLNREAGVYGETESAKFSSGNIKHRIMQELNSQYPDRFQLENLFNDSEKIDSVLYNMADLYFDEYYSGNKQKYSILRENELMRLTRDLYDAIDRILNGYGRLSNSKTSSLKYLTVLHNEYELSGESEIAKRGNILYDLRIDRIDLSEDADYNPEIKNAEVKGKFILNGDTSYSIIDYKNSDKGFRSEQLFFYHYLFEKHPEWSSKFKDKPVFLIFVPLNGKPTNLYKIDKDYIYAPKDGALSYIKFERDYFEKWLDKILSNMEKRNYKPAFSDTLDVERFMSFARETMILDGHDEKNVCRDKNEASYRCGNFSMECEFKQMCSLMMFIKNAKFREN